VSNTPSLYDLGEELTRAFAEIDAELAETDGEFTEAMQQRLDAVELSWSEKVERVALYCRGLAADSIAISTEETRLARRRQAMDKRTEWLRTVYLRHALESQHKTEVRGALATVRIQVNPPAASASVPPEFLDPIWVRRSEPKLSLDKEAVLTAYRANTPLPEGISVTRGTSVRIL